MPEEVAAAAGRARATGARFWVIAQILAICAAIAALADLLLGWAGGYQVFVRIRPGYPAMVPETAVCILVLAIATLCLFRPSRSGPWQLAAQGGGVIVLLVLIAELTQPVRLSNFAPGDAMSAATTIGSLACALTLLIPLNASDRWMSIRSGLASVGACVVCIPVIGYLFNAEALFANPVYTSMALHTALGLLCVLFALVMAAPQHGWIALVLAGENGSVMLRRLLPVIILGPLVLCGLALFATNQSVMSADFRLAVLAFAMILSIGLAAFHFAHRVNLTEQQNATTREALRRSERLRQNSELAIVQAQKVEALGQLVGGVAHDFNNTLTVILGNLELIADEAEAESRVEYLNEAIDAANHAAHLTRQLLAYGRKSRLNPEPLILDKLIEPTLAMFGRLCPATIAIDRSLAAGHVVTEIDAVNFQQSLLNLLINARDAMPRGGHIQTSTSVVSLVSGQMEDFESDEPPVEGTYVKVTVLDDGNGMDAEVRRHASEPFYTSKPAGEGSGLGLSVVMGFCRQSNGGLQIESTAGAGTSVSMYFPVRDIVAPGGHPGPDQPDSERPTGAGVLLVDDEPGVTRVVARQLERDGHKVSIAINAEDALNHLARAKRLPDLVITDLVMPGPIQGHELARRIRDLYPMVRVVIMSGYESERQRRQMPWATDMPFLQKPIDRSMLRAVVASLLDSSRDDD